MSSPNVLQFNGPAALPAGRRTSFSESPRGLAAQVSKSSIEKVVPLQIFPVRSGCDKTNFLLVHSSFHALGCRRQPLQSDSQWSRSAACISFAPGVHTGLISERITVHCCFVECLADNMLKPFYPMHCFHDESARQNCSSGLSHCECTCEWYMRRNYCKRTVSGATAVSPKSAPIPELQWVLAQGTCGLCCSL